MKVKDLINELQKMPQDTEIAQYNSYDTPEIVIGIEYVKDNWVCKDLGFNELIMIESGEKKR